MAPSARGLLLFGVGVLILLVTGNVTLFPTVVLLGNFAVPVAYVAFFYERRHLCRLTMPATSMAFVLGGVLGMMAPGILEPLLIAGASVLSFLLVALIEESVKILGALLIARTRRHDAELDGIILGTAAGMGFAALESTGYAFSAFLRSGGSLSATVVVTLLRGLLASAGHGTWTAILAGTIFRESRNGRFRVSRAVVAGYLTVVLLHWLWDALPYVTSGYMAQGLTLPIAQLAVGAVGLSILWRRWREAVRLQAAACDAQPAECAPAEAQ